MLMLPYISKRKKDWLDKKANEYANEEICTINGNPKNATLIEPINLLNKLIFIVFILLQKI